MTRGAVPRSRLTIDARASIPGADQAAPGHPAQILRSAASATTSAAASSFVSTDGGDPSSG